MHPFILNRFCILTSLVSKKTHGRESALVDKKLAQWGQIQPEEIDIQMQFWSWSRNVCIASGALKGSLSLLLYYYHCFYLLVTKQKLAEIHHYAVKWPSLTTKTHERNGIKNWARIGKALGVCHTIVWENLREMLSALNMALSHHGSTFCAFCRALRPTNRALLISLTNSFQQNRSRSSLSSWRVAWPWLRSCRLICPEASLETIEKWIDHRICVCIIRLDFPLIHFKPQGRIPWRRHPNSKFHVRPSVCERTCLSRMIWDHLVSIHIRDCIWARSATSSSNVWVSVNANRDEFWSRPCGCQDREEKPPKSVVTSNLELSTRLRTYLLEDLIQLLFY